MRILIVDNYDSFTFNLVRMLDGHDVVVRLNDEPMPEDVDAIVFSPGPGDPRDPARVGACPKLLERDVPIVGVCLGHQLIAARFGGRVERARTPVHGKTTLVHHDGSLDAPSPFEAMRYHSLIVTEVPDPLVVTAWTADGEIMAVRHRERPIVGLQFHPESIGTPDGARILLSTLRPRR